MLVEFDDLANLGTADTKLQILKDIKNDMVGSVEIKNAYFEKGLVHKLISLLSPSKKEPLTVKSEAI